MSSIKVGDRVEGIQSGVRGVVTEIREREAMVLIDGLNEVQPRFLSVLRVIAPAPTGTAPVDRVVAGPITLPPLHARMPAYRDAACEAAVAEWQEAIAPPPIHARMPACRDAAKINEQAKALDTVRKFLGSHSLAATSLQCQREAREVMGVVMRALDKGRAER